MDGPKLFPLKQTADPGLLSHFRMDGWIIEIKGLEIKSCLRKGETWQRGGSLLEVNLGDLVTTLAR